MGNITKAILCKARVCRTAPLYQYDYGQILQIVGPELPSAYEVHFSNQPHGTATTQIGGADGVAIPDAYLQTGSPVYAWLYLHTGENDGETEYSITIPVIARARPTNETPTPVQQDAITEAIAALNSGVERAEAAANGIEQTVNDALAAAKASGEFDGKDGTDGTDGIDGVTFTPSVSPSGVLSWTNNGGLPNPESVNIKGAPGQNGLDGMDGVDGKDGPPGKDGTDGVSPAVTIASITGGHSVTITDADHPNGQTFDVMDGETLSLANNAEIKAGTDTTKAIGVSTTGSSAFYGLAKAANDTTQSQSANAVGTYTESAKSAISTMLSSPVTVSGSTPSITALPGIQYVCGEVVTLDITLPASGCIDVVFESGSTPTVLTITPPSGVMEVDWADGFDPDNLSANATYWLKVIDGKLGVATAWGVQSGGGGEKQWNHVQFSVTDESEQTQYFEIINTSVVSEILVTGKVVFDSYDKFVVYIGNACVTYEDVSPSETNCYVGIHTSRSVDIWLGNCNATQWNSIISMFDKVQRPNARSNGVGNIRFGSRWLNKTYLTGTSLDVYWR